MIQPNFGPGSGWLRGLGWSAPGSIGAIKAMREACYPCTVIRMRERGVRVAPAVLLERSHPAGGLLLDQSYTAPAWCADLYELPDMTKPLLPKLHGAVMIRANEGVRLFKGWEVVNGERIEQTWLCMPTLERGLAILREMDWR